MKFGIRIILIVFLALWNLVLLPIFLSNWGNPSILIAILINLVVAVPICILISRLKKKEKAPNRS